MAALTPSTQTHLVLKSDPPATAPTISGLHWIDRIHKRAWISVGTTSAADWIETLTTGGLVATLGFYTADTTAALEAIGTLTTTPLFALTRGNLAKDDGGHALWAFDNTSAAAAIDWQILVPDDRLSPLVNGRWVRYFP